MSGAAWLFLAATVPLAAGDWFAVVSGRKSLELACKPAVLVALILVAVTVHPYDTTARAWFVAALVFSLAGDIFLMLPRDAFVAGLASFFAAHLGYVVGFTSHGVSGHRVAWAAAAVTTVSAVLARRIVAAVAATDRRLVTPVALYVVAITAMFTLAIAGGRRLAAVGAGLFYVSDATIAWNRFVTPKRWAPLAIMVTYHLGQAGLVLSLVH